MQESHASPLNDVRTGRSSDTLVSDYIGNKRGLLEFVTAPMRSIFHGREAKVLDLFSGTGVVSAAFKRMGHVVTANDHLEVCAVLSSAVLLNDNAPRFEGIHADTRANHGSI